MQGRVGGAERERGDEGRAVVWKEEREREIKQEREKAREWDRESEKEREREREREREEAGERECTLMAKVRATEEVCKYHPGGVYEEVYMRRCIFV